MIEKRPGVVDQEEPKTVKTTEVVDQGSVPEPTHRFGMPSVELRRQVPGEERTLRADGTMIVSLVCVAAFSICMVVYVLFPAMQTLVSGSTANWNPGP